MTLQELIEKYPKEFAFYAEKILDSYFGNIFVTSHNQEILYVNKNMAASVHMTKEELSQLSLSQLRQKRLWTRSISQELYEKKAPFDAYNVGASGEELFTHAAPIFDEKGNVVLGVHYSIPKHMLEKFSKYITTESSNLQKYKDIADYMSSQNQAANSIIAKSPAAALAFSEAKYLAETDSTVLIRGETGTGKDVLANYIYRNSKRADQPFIPVNCSAIPSELMESEFFGYEPGAFTGALRSGKPGLFEMANCGTLFLDEIAELPLSMQAKLLRVLETGDVMRIGGTKIRHMNVRIIAATNRDLGTFVREGRFREDLYYRLNVMPIFIPPLRSRQEDILPLAEFFIAQNNQKYEQNRQLTAIVNERLLHYKWPGNIRELRNVIERYVISGRIDLEMPQEEAKSCSDAVVHTEKTGTSISLKDACREFEKNYIIETLNKHQGSVAKSAASLGIHRSLLYKKIQQHGINVKEIG